MRRAILCFFFLSQLSAVLLTAETPLVPRGPAARIDSAAGHDSFDNEAPVPALAPDGNLLVVWGTSGINAGTILVRRFDATGKAGPAETVVSAGLGRESPRIIPFGPDRFLTTWNNAFAVPLISQRRAAGVAGTLSARLLDATGALVGSEVQVDTSGQGAYEPLLAAFPGGGAVAIWETDHLVARFLNAAGQPVGAEIDVAPVQCLPRTAGLVGFPGGGFLALWFPTPGRGSGCTGIQGLVFGADGKPASNNLIRVPYAPAVAVAPSGRFLTLGIDTATGLLRSTLYTADGGQLDTRLFTTADGGPPVPVAVGVDDAGRFLALWTTTGSSGAPLFARLLDSDGIPAGDPFVVSSQVNGRQPAARAVGMGGEWAVTWTGQPAIDAEAAPLFVRRFGPCTGLCLNASRFTVSVDWTNPRDGSTGSGHALPLTGDTGSFWFFDPRNVELDVKVLDGRGVNGHFWVFYASLSDVEFTVKVTDMETGAEKIYHNKPYTLASQADVTAF